MHTEHPRRNRWGLVAAAGLTLFCAQFDSSVVAVALPAVEASLETRTAVAQWAVLGYLVPLIGLSLSAGRWLDTADPRRALLAACTGFALTSVACGLAPDIGWLIAARAAQGVSAAVLLALTGVLTLRAVGPEARGRAFGLTLLCGTLGAMGGPSVGGWLVQAHGWPWIFYLTVPAAVAAALLGLRDLPAGGSLPAPGQSVVREALTFGGGAAALLLALTLAVESTPGWLLLSLGAVPLLLLWLRDATSRPVRGLMRSPGVRGGHVALCASYAALFVLMFLMPFVLQSGAGFTPGTAGLVMTAMAAATAVGSLLGGYLADRLGSRPVAVAGSLLVVLGAVLLLAAPAVGDGQPLDFAWRMACAGLGFGFFNGQNQVLVVTAAPGDRVGLVSGTTNLARQLAIALGSAGGAACWSMAGADGSALRLGAVTVGLLALTAAATTWVTRAPGRADRSATPDRVPTDEAPGGAPAPGSPADRRTAAPADG